MIGIPFWARGTGSRQEVDNMGTNKRIKVLISVIGLDGHSTGAEVVSRILMDAGMEVVYLGIYQTPEMIVHAAIQEGVDVIGISSHASNYDQILALLELLRKNNMDDVCVICGGTIPKHRVKELKDRGISEIFPPQSTSESIVDFIVSHVERAGLPPAA
jgi:methylmalonyl-CoA mutase C-terminal domain/subunit